MNPLILAQEIIDGRRITRKDDLSFFLTCDLDELCEGAARQRRYKRPPGALPQTPPLALFPRRFSSLPCGYSRRLSSR